MEFNPGWLLRPLMEDMAASTTSTPASAALSMEVLEMPLAS